jgi:hypothetical protein
MTNLSLKGLQLLAAGLLIASPFLGGSNATAQHDHSAHAATEAAAAPTAAGPSAALKSTGPVVAGKPAQFQLTLKDAAGKPLGPDGLKVVHEEKIHLLALDPSLTDYQHAHPVAGGAPGVYTFTLTPMKGGEYVAYAEITPADTGAEALLPLSFVVEGEAGKADKPVSNEASAGGYTFKLLLPDGGVVAGKEQLGGLSVTSAAGTKAELEPLMGAPGHIVAFSEDRKEVSHFHAGGADLMTTFHFGSGGYKRVFAQVKIGGKVITAPFGIDVKPEAEGPILVNNKHCPISDEEVGSMEENAYVDVKGYRVGLCCPPCGDKVLKDPDTYLKKALADEKKK